MTRGNTVSDIIRAGWGYYGYPGSQHRAVGEVGYVVDWRADQMVRLEWDVFIDGSPEWVVTLPGEDGTNPEADEGTAQAGGTIATKRGAEEDQTAASMELLELINWTDTNVRAVDTNLFVAGKFDYANLKNGWRVVSTIEPRRTETLKGAKDVIPVILPHPANPEVPNPPLARILELLESLEWLTRQSSTQSRQRVLMNGIVVTGDNLAGSNGQSFWDVWNETLSARQVDPDDMSPVRLQAPSQDVKDGAVDWVLPPFGYDDVLDRKITQAIQRLGWGLPVPPEVLLGMQAQSRATAFQVEENAYRAHIEPPALLVAQVAQDALNKLLPDVKVKVVPNPSKLLARKNSVEDVKWAREQGLVTPEYTREVLAIPEDAAPEPDIDGIPIGTSDPEKDPSNVAAGEGSPITAASSTPDLSDLLADIDTHLSSELAGVTVMATDRARQRLGAAARTKKDAISGIDFADRTLTNSAVASQMGMNALEAAGVDVAERIAEPIDAAAQWWQTRIGQAWEQAATLIPGWRGEGDWVLESLDLLSDALAVHIVSTLSEPSASPLDAGSIRKVLDAAAGGS